jgi:hypothetical protein
MLQSSSTVRQIDSHRLGRARLLKGRWRLLPRLPGLGKIGLLPDRVLEKITTDFNSIRSIHSVFRSTFIILG